jgi:hypothetical protein
MAGGDTELVKQLLAEAPVKTPHSSYKNKRVRQLLDSYLEHGTRIAPAGTLGYTLYTILPNPGRDLTSSWQEVEREWITIKLALQSLGEVGVLCSFLNVETHPPHTKKGKKKRPATAGDPSPEGEEDLEQDDPAPPVPGPGNAATAEAPLHQQALKPHFHAVLIHDLTDIRLADPGFLNRLLASRDVPRVAAGSPPQFQDVQAKPVSLRKHGPTNSICYIFKASGDKLTLFLARRFCPSWTRPLVHLIYPSSSRLWTKSSMQQLIRLSNLYDATLELGVNVEALPPPGFWMQGEECNESVTGPSKQLQVAMRVGRWLKTQGIYYCDGHFVDLEPGTRRVWRLRYKDLEDLLKVMIRLPEFQFDLFKYQGQLLKLPLWAIAAVCPQGTVAYHIFELEDCYMRHARKEAVPGGSDTWFAFIQDLEPETFAAMKIPLRRAECRVDDLYQLRPTDIRARCPKWWQIIANAYPCMANPTDLARYAHARERVEKLVTLLAHSICRQTFKDKVPFLIGESNSGKSSLVEPMKRLYGDSLKAIVQDSAFPMEKVPYARYLVFEEFRLNTIPSNTLFQLTEHGTVQCDIKNYAAREVLADFGMVACSNIYPRFPERNASLQKPLDARFEYFMFDNSIPNPEKGAREWIHDKESPFVIMFMVMVYHGVKEWV